MFNEYDCFLLAKPIPSESIPVGSTGVVLMVHEDHMRQYEVEFLDDNGRNLGSRPTFTITEEFMENSKGSGLVDGNIEPT